MMQKTLTNYRLKAFCGCLLCLSLMCSIKAQNLRTAYFMKDAPYRMKSNPSLMPNRGYLYVPFVGSIYASASSSSLGFNDMIDLFSDKKFYNNESLMSRLSDRNKINVEQSTDLFAMGWYKGDNFWSINVGVRTDIGGEVSKSVFDFLRETDSETIDWSGKQYDLVGNNWDINSYAEVGLGYARAINEKLSVGAKFKVLLGAGNMKFRTNRIYISTHLPQDPNHILPEELASYHAQIKVDAQLEGSFKGWTLDENNQDPNNTYIDDVSFKGYGIAGVGGAVDLGVSYKPFRNVTLSASVLDLGFINWDKNSSVFAQAKEDIDYKGSDYPLTAEGLAQFSADASNFLDRVDHGDLLNLDLLRLSENEKRKRTTSLSSTVVLGAEYACFNDRLSFGALSTTRFLKPKTWSEVTLSTNFRPKKWFNLSLSYSLIQSHAQSFGIAMKLGPVLVGSDYVMLSNNSKSVNAFLGFFIPIGRTR